MRVDRIAETALKRGLALQRSGGRPGAVQSWFRLASCAAPDDDRVTQFAIAGGPKEQLGLCRRVLRCNPTAAAILERAGLLLNQSGAGDDADRCFRRALLVEPGNAAQAAFAVASRAMQTGSGGTAYPLAWQASQRAPGNLGTMVLLASVAAAAGRATAAADAFAAAACLAPSNVAIAVSAAAMARRCDRREATARFARRALLLVPNQAEAMELLSGVVVDTDDTDRWPTRLTATSPIAAMSWSCRSEVNIRTGDRDSAFRNAKRGLLIDPAAQFAARFLASAGLPLAEIATVRRVTRQALLSHRHDPELTYFLAQTEKAVGDLGRGWDLEAGRDTWPRFHRIRGLPRRLLDAPLPGEGLLVASEQGLGDELLFLSCLPDLLAECPSPIVEADARLHPLLSRTFPGLQLIGRQARSDGNRVLFDYTEVVRQLSPSGYVFSGDLAARYRRDRDRPSERIGYLQVESGKRDEWARRLTEIRDGARLVVGVSWSSINRSRTRALYNSSLDGMMELFGIPGIRFVCLQYTDCRAELAAFKQTHGIDIWRPDDLDQREDLDGTFALMSTLDVVVSADTSACMLAAASGVPTLRLGSAVYRILDDRDMFFANMLPMIRQHEPSLLPLAIGRAAAELRIRVGAVDSD